MSRSETKVYSDYVVYGYRQPLRWQTRVAIGLSCPSCGAFLPEIERGEVRMCKCRCVLVRLGNELLVGK